MTSAGTSVIAGTGGHAIVQRTTPGQKRVTPNLFGISFGIAGVAEAWAAVGALFAAPGAVADTIWMIAAVVWVITILAYLRYTGVGQRLRADLIDPVFAPFLAVAGIVPMLLGAALAAHARTAGVTIFAIALIATIGFGGWLIGQWIVSEMTLQQWHPGYFLPTVAGGYLAATTSAELGYGSLAKLMFGYGTVSWLVLGSILLQRLFTQPRLPVPLLPTMAIEVAPPVVAGVAWFAINGGRIDGVALALAGYALLMTLVQLRLVPLYRSVPFGPSWWAFSFSYAAVFVDAIHWLSVEHTTHGQAWAYVLATIVSAAVLVLVLRTLLTLKESRFLPAAPTPAPTPTPTGETTQT
jgi:tellurite resistance protein